MDSLECYCPGILQVLFLSIDDKLFELIISQTNLKIKLYELRLNTEEYNTPQNCSVTLEHDFLNRIDSFTTCGGNKYSMTTHT